MKMSRVGSRDQWRVLPFLAGMGWRRLFPSRRGGPLLLVGLLPGVSLPLTVLCGTSVLAGAALSVGLTVATGVLVGSVPAAVEQGLGSPAGRRALGALAVAGSLFVALTTLAPLWLQGAGSALVLVAFHWGLAVALVLAWLAAARYQLYERLRVTEVASTQSRIVRRAGYVRDLALIPGAAKEVRILGLTEWLIAEFTAEWHRSMAAVWRKRLEGRALAAAVTLLPVAVHLVAFTVLGQAAAQGNISLASLAVFAGAVLGVRHLAPHDQATVNLVYGAVAVPVVLGLERCAAGAPHANPMRTISRLPEGAPRGGIRFEAVGFRYPNGTGDVLEGLELWIPVGQSLAIVGANGAGKTTLIKLLCRLYDPAVGRITVDGADLRAISPDKWRHQIAAIFQDFVQYPLAARDNVGFGAPAAMADVARLQEAARRAGALDVIEALPYAWDTVLSRRFTGGTDLSGGQWQRIALARALFAVATGATMLILDEPTASLDVRAEAALYDRFLDLTSGVTTILISHRFSTVRRADRICVLEQGRVVEQGTHAELLAAGGRYAAMFALQAARFTDAADGAALPERAGAPADTADTMRSP